MGGLAVPDLSPYYVPGTLAFHFLRGNPIKMLMEVYFLLYITI